MVRISDPTFGLDRYAWPLLNLLSTLEPDFAVFDEGAQMYDVALQTHVYCAGDKRWGALVLFPRLTPEGLRSVVTFGRCVYQDEIVVESWSPLDRFVADGYPTPADEHGDARTRRFSPKDIMQAAAFIKAELGSAYEALRPRLPA
jgi:hypothetical protein